jgi:transcriptional regulator with XRE-family HTH domain
MESASHTPASLRARLGLTQAQLAQLASETSGTAVSVSTVGRLEKGRSISLDHVRAIAAALKVEPQLLIDAIDAERARRAGAGSAA